MQNFALCLYKGIGADSSKSYNENYLLMLANKSLFLWWHLETSLILSVNKVSGWAQMMEALSDKGRWQLFEPHWYGEMFLWLSYERLLSKQWCFKLHSFWLNLIHTFTVSGHCKDPAKELIIVSPETFCSIKTLVLGYEKDTKLDDFFYHKLDS